MDIREQLVEYGKKMIECKLVVGPGGNISAREGDFAYLSPSGLSVAELGCDDYVKMNVKTGEVVEGSKRPTSETPLHLECYRRREDVRAVIHAHPPIATGLATGGAQVRAMTPDFVAYVGKVITLPYIVPAGEELARAIGEAIQRCNTVLMINHGAITVGTNLREAFIRAEVLEDSAKLQMAALIAGNPKFLSDKQIEQIDNLAVEAYRRRLLSGEAWPAGDDIRGKR